MINSFLMCDNTEGDGKAEIVMDYVMSWSLRHAVNYNGKRPILRQYCRYMLYKLLQIDYPLEQISFEVVKVWKEWQHMDLCVEVTLSYNNLTKYYALLVENKYYSPLHYKKDISGKWRNQVDVYKEIFENHYTSSGHIKSWNLRYALVSCLDIDDDKIHMYDEAEKYGFKVFSFYDILDESLLNEDKEYIDSESEIFNEFWLRNW